MAITSIGYDGTVDEVQWAKLAPLLGANYRSRGIGLTVVSGSDRTVRVSTGVLFGYGVADTIDATVDLQAGTISSGTRWDTVVLRRNWGSNTSTLQILAGTSTKAQSSLVQSNPGVTDDQVLGLIRLDAGASAVQEIWQPQESSFDPIVTPNSAFPDYTKYSYGQLYVAWPFGSPDLAYRGASGWRSLLAPSWSTLPLSSNAVAGTNTPQYRVIGDTVELRGSVNPAAGGTFSSSLLQIATLATSLQPQVGGEFVVSADGVSASTFHAQLEVRAAGAATLPGALRVKTSGTGVSEINLDGVRFSLT